MPRDGFLTSSARPMDTEGFTILFVEAGSLTMLHEANDSMSAPEKMKTAVFLNLIISVSPYSVADSST
jgi:hypothetical protein